MYIAEQLGKFEHEVLTLTLDEYARWRAYFRIKQQEEKKAQQRARRNSKIKSRQGADPATMSGLDLDNITPSSRS